MLLPATSDDLPFLREMLVVAAFPPGTDRPAEPLADDHVARYLDGWGRPDDAGLVAWEDGRRVGACWLRRLPADRAGYGFVDAATPELTIAVVREARGRGLGRALCLGALDLGAAHGRERVSLSVADAVNPGAHHLYRTVGFTPVGRVDGSLTMVAPTAPRPPGPGEVPETARPATVDDGPALARLRQVMLDTDDRAWIDPFLRLWPPEGAAGRWIARVADGPDGRPVASALAALSVAVPAPGRVSGRTAHVGNVATEPAWRRRGLARSVVTALLDRLDDQDVPTNTLTATPEGATLYLDLGFRVGNGQAMRRTRPSDQGGS